MNGLNSPSLHRRDTITKGDFLIMLVTIVMNFHSLVVHVIGAKVLMFCLQFGAIWVGPGCRRL